MEFVTLLMEYIKNIGLLAPEALVQSLVVLVAVLGLRLMGLIPTSNWSRAANVVLSVLLTGIESADQAGLVVPMTVAFAAGLWDFCSYLYSLIMKGKQPFPTAKKK